MRARWFPALVGAVLGSTSCQTAPPSVESPVQSLMFQHFALARDLRVLVVAADMDELRTTARELASPRQAWGLPPGAEPYLERIREAASRAATSRVAGEVSRAVADVARECGDCHLTVQSTLGSRFQVAEPRTDDPAIRHANRLSWISRLLWDGLVGPSERMWRTGAEALAVTDGVLPPAASHVPAELVARAEARLSALAKQALAEEEATGRSEILASLWTVCADCHVAAGI